MIKIKVLGTGTSTGVPVITCSCSVCSSNDFKNKRLRCSIFLEAYDSNNKLASSTLIDTSPDFRQQALANNIKDIDSIIYTHAHADHTHGIDDLRVFNFGKKKHINVYAKNPCHSELLKKFAYLFFENPNYEGGLSINLKPFEINGPNSFEIPGITVQPIPIFHGKSEILGFRFSDFAYITDASNIPEESYPLLDNLKYLVINGLRHKPHNTHFTVKEAVSEIKKINPERAWLTHISHDLDHEKESRALEETSNGQISLAYDGMVLEIDKN